MSPSTVVKIGVRKAGPGYPIFVIAEVGSNHNRDLERCLAFIDAAAGIGCGAIKFQLFRVRELLHNHCKDLLCILFTCFYNLQFKHRAKNLLQNPGFACQNSFPYILALL